MLVFFNKYIDPYYFLMIRHYCHNNYNSCNKHNNHSVTINLQITFEDTLAEPESARSIECVWKYSHKCFNLWKALCYVIFTTLCGIPCAMCWGCGFACVAINHIWLLTPCVACISIPKRCVQMTADCCVKPCHEAAGWIFWAFKK